MAPASRKALSREGQPHPKECRRGSCVVSGHGRCLCAAKRFKLRLESDKHHSVNPRACRKGYFAEFSPYGGENKRTVRRRA